MATLAEPFQRGTERIRTDHAGVGLGLAIVKSITQAHDGTLTLTPRAAGGLCRHGATTRRRVAGRFGRLISDVIGNSYVLTVTLRLQGVFTAAAPSAA